jgi:hypothetical protein
MYTVGAVSSSSASLTLGSQNINTDELGPGDSIYVYDPTGKPLGEATVSTMTATTSPVPAGTVDEVFFSTTMDSYNWFVVRALICTADCVIR